LLARIDDHLAMTASAGSKLPAYIFDTLPLTFAARSASGSFPLHLSVPGKILA
jgi:hypothetical protein